VTVYDGMTSLLREAICTLDRTGQEDGMGRIRFNEQHSETRDFRALDALCVSYNIAQGEEGECKPCPLHRRPSSQ